MLINPAGANGALGDGDDPTKADLLTIFNTNTTQFGGIEDGWDAIEHAIAEYDFRDGAVVIFVLVQNDEGRIELNDALTVSNSVGRSRVFTPFGIAA